MRIAELIGYHVRIPLRKTIRHASHTRDDTDSLIVCCRLEDGTEGWGEGLPRAYVTGETIDSAWNQLQQTDLRRQLAASFGDLPAALQTCDALRLAPGPAGTRDCFGNSLRCALELSVLDAAARAAQVPLSHVTALVPETLRIRQQAERVRYSAALTATRPVFDWLGAYCVLVYGFAQCKVKVGVAGYDEVKTLARLRRMCGQRLTIRVDANEAWTCANLAERLARLAPYRIASVEQPVPHADVDGLAALRGQLPVPIVLDESLCSLRDGHRAVERGTCDLFNIRLSKCGGFLNSLRLAALAHQAGLGYQLGCQVGETGILSAAGRHFAASVAGLAAVEGSYDRYLVRERLITRDISFRYGGYAPALPGPGLGVDIDRRALQRVLIRETRIPIGT